MVSRRQIILGDPGAVSRVGINGGERDITLSKPAPRLIRMLVSDWAEKNDFVLIGGQHLYRAAFVIFFTCKLDSSLGLRGWRQTSPSPFPPPHPLQTYCSLQVFSGLLLANAQAASLTEGMLSVFICSIHSAVQICETYKTYKYTISSDNYFYAKVKVIVLISVVTTILQLSLTDNNRGP